MPGYTGAGDANDKCIKEGNTKTCLIDILIVVPLVELLNCSVISIKHLPGDRILQESIQIQCTIFSNKNPHKQKAQLCI